MTALTAEEARCAVGIVATVTGAERGLVGDLQRTARDLQISGQGIEIGNRCGREGTGLVFAESAFDDAVGVRRIVERGFLFPRTTQVG